MSVERIKEILHKRMDELNLSFYDLSLILNRREKQIKKWFSKEYDINLRVLCMLSTALKFKLSVSHD